MKRREGKEKIPIHIEVDKHIMKLKNLKLVNRKTTLGVEASYFLFRMFSMYTL